MMEKLLDGAMLVTLLNNALQLDPQAQEKLALLEGKTIAIKLDMREQPWVLSVLDGHFVFDGEKLGDECDVRLRGSLTGFLRLFAHSERSQGVNDKLYIEGDLHSAQQFQRVMASLQPDFEAVLRQRFGQHLGSRFARALTQLREQGEQARTHIEQRLQDYLGGDNARCATRSDAALLDSRLHHLRLTLDRLDARISHLEC